MKIGGNVFCGYYDVMSLSADDKYLIYHKVDFIDRMPAVDDACAIYKLDTETGGEVKLGDTTAWNWQQGSRLQWIGPTFDKFVAYNKFIDNKLCGIILDVELEKTKVFNSPFYSISHDGKKAVTYDFARLARARSSYSYAALASKASTVLNDSGIGLTVVNLENGSSTEILSIDDLVSTNPASSMGYGCHWIDTPSISPDGTCIFFLHRWEIEGGFFSRLYSIDIDGSKLTLIVNSGTVNHISVLNNDEVIFDGVSEGGLNKYRKYTFFNKIFKVLSPFYHRFIGNRESLRQKIISHYYYCSSKSRLTTDIVARDLTSVAHPSVFRGNPNIFLADTYEDQDNKRHLFLCSTERNSALKLASFDSPSKYNSTKCRADLHPTWNISGTKFIVDIIENNERKIVIGDITPEQFLSEKEDYINFYEKNRDVNYAHDYDNYVPENDGHFGDLALFVKNYNLAEKKVLEIGSSGGFFQNIVEDYSGTDVSELLAKHYHKRYKVALGTTYPFDDGEFDAIFTFDTFEHIPHLQEAMVDTVRMLKVGGVILFQPAWQCRSWAAEGYPVRPYSDFNVFGRLIKLSVPVRDSIIYRSIKLLPKRAYRHLAYFLGKRFHIIRYKSIKPNYEIFWMSDSDACNHIDPHDAILWFQSHGFECLTYPTPISQLFVKNGGIVFQKTK